MKVIIDRFEGNFAVVELPDSSHVQLPAVLVPDAKEGSIISIEVDVAETKRRAQAVEELMNDLFAD